MTCSMLLLMLCMSAHSAVAQNRPSYEHLLNTEIPLSVPSDSINLMITDLDAIISGSNKDAAKQAAYHQVKGQLLLQLGQIEQAAEAYNQANDLIEGLENYVLRVKVLSGLGQLAMMQARENEASQLFNEVLMLSRAEDAVNAFVWIFYHSGGTYLRGAPYQKEEIKAVADYADGELYSNPPKALELANWLIENSGEHHYHVYDGYMVAGLVYRDWGELHTALELFEKARIHVEEKVQQNGPLFSALLNIAAVYAMQNEQQASLDATLEVLALAREKGEDRSVAYALKDIGITHTEMGNPEKSVEYFQQAIPAMRKVNDRGGEGVCIANLGNAYIDLKAYDKAIENLDRALPILKETGYDLLYASTLITKGWAYIESGTWQKAGDVALEGIQLADELNSQEFKNIGFRVMIAYYAHLNSPGQVRAYEDSLFHGMVESQKRERITISENLKVRYETEKKEAQLSLQLAENRSLSIENRAQKTQRNVFLVLALLFIILLVLLMNRYQLGKKLAKEKEARLQDQVLLSELETAQKKAENEHLESQVQYKQRELTSLTLQMAQKNDALDELQESISKNKDLPKASVKDILSLIGNQKNIDKDWGTFKAHFDEVHPSFFEKLRTAHPGLSQTEEKHSAYMRMGLATKEIARLMNISPSSVQVSRYRLKKKMALGKEADIYQYINNI